MMDYDEQLASLRARLIPEPDLASEEIEKLKAQIVMLEHANKLLSHALMASRFESSAVIAANRVLNEALLAERKR